MDVSIIIVNYNTLDLTKNCINSVIEKTKGIDYEIILVDNASSDGSKDYFSNNPNITYIYNVNNLGFGTANNIGAKVASGKYLFLLNSDTLLIDNSIKIFFDYMEANTTIAACGGNIINAKYENTFVGGNFPSLINEFLQIGFYRFINTRINRKISITQKCTDLETDSIDYIIGADIFIRHNIFKELKGFDESFFMYYEETDLFKRMSKLKYKSIIIPNTTIVHLVGASSSTQIGLMKYRMIHTSKILYYRKHKSNAYVMLVKLFDFIAVALHPHCYSKEYFKILKESIKG